MRRMILVANLNLSLEWFRYSTFTFWLITGDAKVVIDN